MENDPVAMVEQGLNKLFSGALNELMTKLLFLESYTRDKRVADIKEWNLELSKTFVRAKAVCQ